jgi:hypothetical protein
MHRKLVLSAIALILILCLISPVFADLTAGVKKGDWMEYSVTTTGSPTHGLDINWARIEVTDVQGTNVTVGITSRFPNGSIEVFNYTLNLKTGYLIDDFVIPANLKAGDTFFDQNLGNVTISHTEQNKYAGATRTVVYASTNQSTYIWDQVTGVSVEVTYQQPEYSMHTIVEDTNMWRPSEGLDMAVLLIIAVIAVTTIAVAVMVMAFLKHRKKKISH